MHPRQRNPDRIPGGRSVWMVALCAMTACGDTPPPGVAPVDPPTSAGEPFSPPTTFATSYCTDPLCKHGIRRYSRSHGIDQGS